MVKRLRLIGLGVTLCLHSLAWAEEGDMPTGDFLEYLATLVEQDGEWVDPLELEELPDDELDDLGNSETNETDAPHAEETP